MFSIPGSETFDGFRIQAVFLREFLLCLLFRGTQVQVDSNSNDFDFESWISSGPLEGTDGRIHFVTSDSFEILHRFPQLRGGKSNVRSDFIRSFRRLCLQHSKTAISVEDSPQIFEFLYLEDGRKEFLVREAKKLFSDQRWLSFLEANMSPASYQIIAPEEPQPVLTPPTKDPSPASVGNDVTSVERERAAPVVEVVEPAPEVPSFVVPKTRDARFALLLVVWNSDESRKGITPNPSEGYLLDAFFPSFWPEITKTELAQWLNTGKPNDKIAAKLNGC